jgi:hypothetical protein
VGFSFERVARSRKAKGGLRALFGKPPAAADIKDRLARLLPRAWRDADVQVTAKAIRVTLDGLPTFRVRVLADGEIVVHGRADIGPGLADEAIAGMAPVLDELDYAWDDDDFAPRGEAVGWLADELRAGQARLGMPEGRTFWLDDARAAVQTSMGPRDAAWRDAVLADPRAGADAFAWWQRGPGQLERARALWAMWHEVPWREPVDKPERAVMARVDADLTAAHAADPSLDLPYAEWAAIAAFLGEPDRADELRARATGPATIGYRRFDMTVGLENGWSLRLPGAFVGAWEAENDRYLATDGARAVQVLIIETTETDSAQLLAVAPPRYPVIEHTTEPDRHARAEMYTEDHTHVVHGLVAMAPHVAIFTFRGDARDHAWALATWRTLRRREP